jgi:ElaB/YqjD/DUF883 family membrane-anchored ribosome-binding protein
MPTGNQGQSQGRHNEGRSQGQHNGGSAPTPQGVRESVRDVGQRLQEGAEQFRDRAREGFDTAREGVERRYRRAEGMVARNPSESVMIAFGIGVGLGVLLTIAMTQREETWAERHAPDSLRDMSGSLRDLPEALRRLPDQISATIARHWPKSMSFH